MTRPDIAHFGNPRSDWLEITRAYNQVCDERDQLRYALAYMRLKVEVEARRLQIELDDLATPKQQRRRPVTARPERLG